MPDDYRQDTLTTDSVDQEANEAPQFAQSSYTMELAENAAAALFGFDVGPVVATDSDNDRITYSIVAGDPDGRFVIDETGFVVYVGTGEDYESGRTSYELTVRASDGDLYSDVAVTVNITDVQEAPAFGETRYAFDLAENADGGADRLVLGAVSAADPEGGTVVYSLVGGNDAGLFEIDAASGDLFYTGTGEEYESGRTSYELTVRASESDLYSDVAVTVNIIEVEENAVLGQGANEAPQFAQSSYTMELAENAAAPLFGIDVGPVSATDPEGSTVTYSIVAGDPDGLFAIDETGYVVYVGAGEDYESGPASYELTVRASAGAGHSDVVVTVNITDIEEDVVHEPPANEAPVFASASYAFDLQENAAGDPDPVSLGTVAAEDPEDDSITYSIMAGNSGGLFAIDRATGALSYLGRGEDYESGTTRHELTVRASDGTDDSAVTVTVNVTDVEDYEIQEQGANEAPVFTATAYFFGFNENVAGDPDPVSLGTVAAEDPEDDSITYSIESGNSDGLFAIDRATGALSYLGPGEDHESGTSHELTVRASAGTGYSEVTVTVSVGDVQEAPAFGQDSYAFDLPENVAGDPDPLALGSVSATDPEGASVTYSIMAGNSGGLFAINRATGALSYLGRGEDYESGTTRHELTVRASDGTDDSDVTVTINVTDDTNEEEYVSLRQGIATDVSEPNGSDFPAATSTAGVVTAGGEVTGRIEAAGDRDWFAMTLEAGKAYKIDLEGSRTGAGTLSDPYLRGVYHANGDRISGTTNDDGGTGYNSRVFFTATEAGTYYVAAGAFKRRQGSYTLSVTEPADDYLAGSATDGAVVVGGSANGVIEFRNDRDWFAVRLEAGKTYRIDLEGSSTGAGTLRDPYLRGIYDADGGLISGTTDDRSGVYDNSRVDFTATEDAVYYVAAGGDGGAKGTYTLSVAEIADDYPAETATSGALAVGESANGEIEYDDDRDWFAVRLEAGRTYRIDLEGSWTGNGTLRDPYLRGIHDAEGNLLSDTTNDDGGTGYNSRVDFTATEDAIYYVAAGADEGVEGTYRLSVTDITHEVPDDFEAGTDTSGTVAVGGSANGEIEYEDDRDWFAVELEAGKTYRIDLEGSDTDAGTLRDPYLRGIYDEHRNLLFGTTDDNDGVYYNSRVDFTATADATYYVAAGADGDAEGTYTLSVTEVADDYAAGPRTGGVLTVGGSANGKIEYEDDRDWFAVRLEAGKTYRIDLEGSDTDAGTLRDPYLRGIQDAEGYLLSDTTNDDGGAYDNSRVEFTATEDAIYYVAAGADGGAMGTYTLSVTDITNGAPDDLEAGTDTSGTVAVGGSANGEIEYELDRDWFAVELQAGRTYRIDLEGLWTGKGTLRDPYLRGVHDAEGNLLSGTANDDGGAYDNSRVEFTATADATHYVAAGTAEDAEGGYTLSVTDITNGVPDDFEAGTETSGTVAVGGAANGEIEYKDDRDWFAVELQAGKTYRIDLEGSDTDAGTLQDPYLRGIHDADGNLLFGTTNDDGWFGPNDDGLRLDSRLDFTATADATYYVAAGAQGSAEGTYTLSVTDLTSGVGVADDFEAGTETNGAVVVGGSANGEIDYTSDRDWFAVTLEAGKTYRIDLEGSQTGAGTLSDPYLRGVYNADGDLIFGTTNDDGGEGRNSRVDFTATADATYYVAAGGHLNAEGTYTLTIDEVL